jgi:hypothetical protein
MQVSFDNTGLLFAKDLHALESISSMMPRGNFWTVNRVGPLAGSVGKSGSLIECSPLVREGRLNLITIQINDC